jgi:gliding motility-associated-like protein
MKILNLLFFLIFCFTVLSQQTRKAVHSSNTSFYFIENKGQWNEDVLFKSSFKGGNLWIQKSKLFFHLKDFAALRENHGGKFCDTCTNKQHALHINFKNCNEINSTEKLYPSKEYYNYFIGNDQSKWTKNVYGYQQVIINNLYNGIDLKLIQNDEETKYEYIVQPNVSPNQIELEIAGATDVIISKYGELIIKTPLGNIQENKPYAYQIIDNKTVEVRCDFQLKNNTVSYKIGKYNPDFKLIIDPVLVFATYSGSTTDNFGMTATYGHDGSVYSGGTIFGNNYPTPDKGVYNYKSNFTLVNGDTIASDVFISKYSSDGTKMIWTNFIGGGSDYIGAETVHSLICDSLDNLYAYGATSSQNFPTTENAFQRINQGGTKINIRNNGALFGDYGTDIFTFKLSSNGKQLIGSTLIGGKENDGLNYNSNGKNAEYQSFIVKYNNKLYFAIPYDSLTSNYGDQFRGEIYLDKQNNIIIASSTHSIDFPLKNPLFNSKNGKQDGVILILKNDFSDLIFSSYIGGSENDAINSIKIDQADNLFFCGGTCSTNLPNTTGAYQVAYNGGISDGFVGKINSDFTKLKLSYLGEKEYDHAFMLDLNSKNEVYIVGNTFGGNFPVKNALFSNPKASQFICVLDSSLSTLLKSTTYGSGKTYINDVSPCAFMVDDCDNIYVSGWGGNILENNFYSNVEKDYLSVKLYDEPNANSIEFKTDNNIIVNIDPNAIYIKKFSQLENMPITGNSLVNTPPNGFDFHLFALDKNFSKQIYGTYMGGSSSDDHVDGGTSRFDKSGIIYQSICGGCGGKTDFIPKMNANVHSDTNLSSNCNNIVLKFDFEIMAVPNFTFKNDTICENTILTYENLSKGFDSFYWFSKPENEIDSINSQITKKYLSPGEYEISMNVKNEYCPETQALNHKVVVLKNDIKITPFQDEIICGPSLIHIDSKNLGTKLNYEWYNFTLQQTPLNSDITNPSLDYYLKNNIRLFYKVSDGYCFDTTSINLSVRDAKLILSEKDIYCTNDSDTLIANVLNSNEFFQFDWKTAHNYISSKHKDSIILTPSFNENIIVNAIGDQGCNLSDTISIKVFNPNFNNIKPIAEPKTIFKGEFVKLSEQTANYSYIWKTANDSIIGSGNPQKINPSKTTFYKLISKNNNCIQEDTVNVYVIDDWVCDFPYIFVPNAFSPNGDFQNDILYVRGRPAYQIEFRVFNRWGENVFYSNDITKGWDGTYKGEKLPPDVYDYYLIVVCLDGVKKQIQGNVTLLK